MDYLHAEKGYGGGGCGGGSYDRQTPYGVAVRLRPVRIHAECHNITGRDRVVDIYDDYFKPSVTVIPVGTTVQWTNNGRHLANLQ